jgi:hypothetical protein
MNETVPRSRLGWSAWLLIGLCLIIAGAAAATWGLARYNRAASFLGVVPPQRVVVPQRVAAATPQTPEGDAVEAAAVEARIAGLEARLGRVENAARRAEGSAGRTDALVVAFATRRAVDSCV